MSSSRLPWFRFWVEDIHDPGLRRLSHTHRWLWVVAHAFARRSPTPGYLLLPANDGQSPIKVSEEDLADAATMRVADVRRGVQALQGLGILVWDEHVGAMRIANWPERQFDSDRSTERVRAHRARRQRSTGTDPPVAGNDNETLRDVPPERFSNADTTVSNGVDETLLSRARATDTDTETEKDIPPGDAAAPRAAEAPPNGTTTGATQRLVAGYVAACPHRPPQAVLGALAKQVKRLVDQGFAEPDIAAAVDHVRREGLGPTALHNVINEQLNADPGPRRRGGHVEDDEPLYPPGDPRRFVG